MQNNQSLSSVPTTLATIFISYKEHYLDQFLNSVAFGEIWILAVLFMKKLPKVSKRLVFLSAIQNQNILLLKNRIIKYKINNNANIRGLVLIFLFNAHFASTSITTINTFSPIRNAKNVQFIDA
jgi:hypothetical protein